MNTFDLFWMTNEDSSVMKMAYRRSTFFLGLLQGPKVDDWVLTQAATLCTKVAKGTAKDSKTLWDDLKQAFENAYVNTGQIKQALMELQKHKMEADLIDNYITKFKNLLAKGGIPHTEVGTIEKFKDGLKRGILQGILNQDTWPTTIDGWEEAARREVRHYGIMKEALSKHGQAFSKPSKWQADAHRFFGKKKNDPVPMEVNAATTQERKAKRGFDENLKKEGCCFHCHTQGHMKKDCPKKNQTFKGKPFERKKGPKEGGRQAIIEELEEDEEDTRELACRIQGLDDDKRNEVFQNTVGSKTVAMFGHSQLSSM